MENILKICPSFKITVISLLITLKDCITVDTPQTLKNVNVFSNCKTYSIQHKESTNISVKIFKNGTIHVTGCRTLETAAEVPYIILKKEKLDHMSFVSKILMINSSFKVNAIESLRLLKDRIKVNYKSAVYQPCKYHGLNIKSDDATLLVFSSGSVCIIADSPLKILDNIVKFKSLCEPLFPNTLHINQ